MAPMSAAPRQQRGVALILVLMLAVTASAFVILQALNNRSSHDTAQRLATAAALGQARRALLGYAVGYADGTNAGTKGPGRLPCPDRAGGSAQGIAEGVGVDCRASLGKETGLLPFRTLGLNTLTDGSGAPLWYAVSSRFRSLASNIVNSETVGTFRVDDETDVVAVIIAPGPALVGQLRDGTTAYSAGAWLEGENATLGDNRFTRINDASHNDTVMVITRADLMVEVEKVVLHEIDNALRNYRDDPDGDDDASGVDPNCAPNPATCDNGLPWLATRSAGDFVGVVGEGSAALASLPLTQLDMNINVDFTAIWSLSGVGTITYSGSEAPSEACVRRNSCTQPFLDHPASGPPNLVDVSFPSPVSGAPSAPWSQGSCVLSRATVAPYALSVSCFATYNFSVPGRTLRRTYLIKLDGGTELVAPTPAARRMVQVRALNGNWPAGTPGTILVTDHEGATEIGSAKLEFTTLGAANLILLRNIPFDLEVWSTVDPLYHHFDRHLSPGALPGWLVADKWHQNLLLRYAPSESPGNGGPSCVAAGNCLTLRMSHPGDSAATDVAGMVGVVIAAGPPLPAIPQNRPSVALSDLLEGSNKDDTTLYERKDPSSSFNDQILPLSPAP